MPAWFAAWMVGIISLGPAGAKTSTSTFWVMKSSTIAVWPGMSPSVLVPWYSTWTPSFLPSARAASFIVVQNGLSTAPPTKAILISARGFFAPAAGVIGAGRMVALPADKAWPPIVGATSGVAPAAAPLVAAGAVVAP